MLWGPAAEACQKVCSMPVHLRSSLSKPQCLKMYSSVVEVAPWQVGRRLSVNWYNSLYTCRCVPPQPEWQTRIGNKCETVHDMSIDRRYIYCRIVTTQALAFNERFAVLSSKAVLNSYCRTWYWASNQDWDRDWRVSRPRPRLKDPKIKTKTLKIGSRDISRPRLKSQELQVWTSIRPLPKYFGHLLVVLDYLYVLKDRLLIVLLVHSACIAYIISVSVACSDSQSLRSRQPTKWLHTPATEVWQGWRVCRSRLPCPAGRHHRGSASLVTRSRSATHLPRHDLLLATCRTPAWLWRLQTSCTKRCATKVNLCLNDK